ncbi:MULTISPECIES: hypothetical protein [Streptomyces]|uniref:Uncharacterized protein n=1 Tax=Streptomyces chartreusis NRRL 3882 TaxID=1079985 RepID=A0A2N9BBW9_STRCX|nr:MULTISPECIES: hypothetical protein [Streptomyces]MYS90412.1 hypothetical protein [Streptomyces sp. SID5464]SOR80864.1 hypothetical protein SCNRRL3882_4317 [Streptomyces chartreusis NRRL 3882]
MIEQVAHEEPGWDPAGVGLALAVAYALHAPTGRAPEVASAKARPAGRAAARRAAARRRKVRG